MSQVTLQGNASGTGIFTLAAPNSNTNRTLNLPDAGGDVVLNDATQTLTNKSIVATQLTGDVAAARITTALNASGSAPIYATRAWVNFDGNNSPGTIAASGNVSSVTRNGTGDYTINFATAMPDANYCVSGSGVSTNTTASLVIAASNKAGPALSMTTTAVRVYWNAGSSQTNAGPITVAITR